MNSSTGTPTDAPQPIIHLSVVSHGQWALVKNLLHDISKLKSREILYVTVTFNLAEGSDFSSDNYDFSIYAIFNSSPKGFGENHNQAFKNPSIPSTIKYFAVINPDIRLTTDIFPILISGDTFKPDNENRQVGVVAPQIVNGQGIAEDSAREIPTPSRIIAKIFGKRKAWQPESKNERYFPDWTAGMFMVFSKSAYAKLSGFNTKFFLYYEDVDICSRLWLNNYAVVVQPNAKAIHNAQRDSHRKLKFLIWHISSMLKFFISLTFFKIKKLHQKRNPL